MRLQKESSGGNDGSVVCVEGAAFPGQCPEIPNYRNPAPFALRALRALSVLIENER